MNRWWNESKGWVQRGWWPPFSLPMWARQLDAAKAAPAPRINLLAYAGLVREVPETHRGRVWICRIPVIPKLDYRPLVATPLFEFQELGYREVRMGYRWVP